MGVANERSIAWGISQKLSEAGAELAFTYLGDALKKRVVPLAEKLNSNVTFSCDVEKKEDVKVFLSDPYGSALYNYYKKDELKAEGNSITEGIGQGRITENLKQLVVDDAVRINDKEALEMIFKLLKEEGLFLGGSSGINVCGAIKMAEKLGPGHNVVTILCDSGQRYQSKIWNKSFLKSKDLPFPSWME